MFSVASYVTKLISTVRRTRTKYSALYASPCSSDHTHTHARTHTNWNLPRRGGTSQLLRQRQQAGDEFGQVYAWQPNASLSTFATSEMNVRRTTPCNVICMVPFFLMQHFLLVLISVSSLTETNYRNRHKM